MKRGRRDFLKKISVAGGLITIFGGSIGSYIHLTSPNSLYPTTRSKEKLILATFIPGIIGQKIYSYSKIDMDVLNMNAKVVGETTDKKIKTQLVLNKNNRLTDLVTVNISRENDKSGLNGKVIVGKDLLRVIGENDLNFRLCNNSGFEKGYESFVSLGFFIEPDYMATTGSFKRKSLFNVNWDFFADHYSDANFPHQYNDLSFRVFAPGEIDIAAAGKVEPNVSKG